MPRSGYGARTTQISSGSSCENWYGLGDRRCPSRFGNIQETEEYWKNRSPETLLADIGDIEQQLEHYHFVPVPSLGQIRTGWFVFFSELLEKKQAELEIIKDAQKKQREKERLAREKIEKEQEAFLARIREEIIRSTAKPKETVIVTPETVAPPETIEEAVKYSPLLIAGIGIIVFIIILRRRA